jgi:hypothetical protein
LECEALACGLSRERSRPAIRVYPQTDRILGTDRSVLSPRRLVYQNQLYSFPTRKGVPIVSRNPSKTLEILFDIKQEAINHDLRRAEEDTRSISTEISSLFAVPLAVRTPETDAKIAHLFMVEAHEICRRDSVAPELNTFFAAFAAGHIVQDAETVAWGKDTCAALSSRMNLIRRREGLADDEDWVFDEGPQDYRELDDKVRQVLERVEDTVFVFVLRRYRMDEHADLFERDRREFEIQREIGSRVNSPPCKETENTENEKDDYFRREYGSDALERVRSRVKEIHELLGDRMTEFQE